MAATAPIKFALAAFLLFAGCQSSMQTGHPQQDINAVLDAHSSELMARPGVVGVYAGLLADEKTPCIKVMLKEAPSAGAKKFPKALEGYPVSLEISGEIKPLQRP